MLDEVVEISYVSDMYNYILDDINTLESTKTKSYEGVIVKVNNGIMKLRHPMTDNELDVFMRNIISIKKIDK